MNNLEIFEFKTLDSTSDFLLQIPYIEKNQLCIADIQTSGRGQYGRKWANQTQNALFSLKVKLPIDLNINGISLIVGLAIVKSLSTNYNLQNLQVKWPNDIFLDGVKMGGVLLENIRHQDYQLLVIGVGLNILSENFASIGKRVNSKQVILRICENILHNIEIFIKDSFKAFATLWQQHDYLVNNFIKITHKGTIGMSVGVNDDGFLIFTNIMNNKQVIISSSQQIKCRL